MRYTVCFKLDWVQLIFDSVLCEWLEWQVAVRYRQNVGSLSIDMSTDTRPIYRSRCVGQHSDRHIGRDIGRYVGRHVDRRIDGHIGRESVDMSTDISVEHRLICRPTVDRYVGRDVDQHIGWGVRKLHMIHDIFKFRNFHFTVILILVRCEM